MGRCSSTCSRRRKSSTSRPSIALTINGIHLSDEGYKRLAPVLDEALFGPKPASTKADMKALFDAVQEKNLQFFYDYRAVNGCYIYGGRKAAVRRGQFPGRVRQAPQDDPEPRAADLGDRPGQDGPRHDRRQQHRRVRHGRDQLRRPHPHHDARGGAQDLHPAGGLRDQPVRLGGRVPRPGRPRVDDLRREGPDVGHHDAVVPDVPAGAEAERQDPDLRGRQRRRQGRQAARSSPTGCTSPSGSSWATAASMSRRCPT